MKYATGGVQGQTGVSLMLEVPIAGKPLQPAAVSKPGATPAPDKEVESNDIAVELADSAGKPAAGISWKLTLPNGREKTGKTGSDGRIAVPGTGPGGDCRLILPEFESGDAPAQPQGATQPQGIAPQPAAGGLAIDLLDAKGKPAAGVDWELTLPDGAVRKGKTDADGRIAVDGIGGDGDCKLVLPAVDQAA